MAAVTGCTSIIASPALGLKEVLITTPSTADSNDSIDVSSSSVTGGPTFSSIVWVGACDSTTGDEITATWSGTTITLDAAGGTTNHVYQVRVIGVTS